MKNSNPIATLVSASNPTAHTPRQGSTVATITTAISVSVKLSGTKRERAIGGRVRKSGRELKARTGAHRAA